MGEPSENQLAKSTRRQWTIQEDTTLVEGLLQLVDDGWKADAGTFKPGYTKELERYICKKIPNCTLKATPHIESRVKLLKRQYGAIKEMLGPNATGFGWDDTRKMIIVEQEIYKQWCKSHSTTIGLYGKPFPHFDSLDIIYGKDRAIGANAESPADAAFSMMREFFQTSQESESTINLEGMENISNSQNPETFTCNVTQASRQTDQPQCDVTTNRVGKRAGKRVRFNDDVSDSLVTSINKLCEFHAGTTENINQLTSCFFHEKETAEKKKQVTKVLEEIVGLSEIDIVKASILIIGSDNLCNCFFTMETPTRRKAFVDIILNK